MYVLEWFVNAIFFFKQKTAYEMRISDWSSDVCSSDLFEAAVHQFKDAPNVIDVRNIGLVAGIEMAPRAGAPGARAAEAFQKCFDRSEERRVGKDGVSTCRSRWSPEH